MKQIQSGRDSNSGALDCESDMLTTRLRCLLLWDIQDDDMDRSKKGIKSPLSDPSLNMLKSLSAIASRDSCAFFRA